MIDTADRKIMYVLNLAGATDQLETCVKLWEMAQGGLDVAYFGRSWWQDGDWRYFELGDGSLAVQGHVQGSLGDVLFTFWAPDEAETDGNGVMALFKKKPQYLGRLPLLKWVDNEWAGYDRLVANFDGMFNVYLQLEQGAFVVYTVSNLTGDRVVCPGGPFTSVIQAKVAAQRWLNERILGSDQQ